MRPSDFKLNTDYLTIANVDKFRQSITVPPFTLNPGQTYLTSLELVIPGSVGCFIQTYIHHDSWQNEKIWGAGNGGTILNVGGVPVYVSILTYLVSNDRIRVDFFIDADSDQPVNVPMQSVQLKFLRFKIPNLF